MAEKSGHGDSSKRGGARGPKRDDRGRAGKSGKPGRSGEPGAQGKPGAGRPKRDDRRTADDKRGERGPRRDDRRSPDGGRRGEAWPPVDRSPRDDRRSAQIRDTTNDLPWPEEIFELELDPDVMKELEAFGGRPATLAKHLLSVGVLAESDPQASYQHAVRVRERIPRSALARQTACIAAYRIGRFKEALKEESAYRRICGAIDLVPIAADCERGLGRPTRALSLVTEYEHRKMDADTRTELFIVGGGARRDLGDTDAARVLFTKAVRSARTPMSIARAHFALGEFLASVGEVAQARNALQSAADVDEDDAWTEARSLLETLA